MMSVYQVTFLKEKIELKIDTGELVCILQNVHYVRRSDLETDDLECIWIEVIPEHGKNFLVASGYRHSTDSDFFDRFSLILDKANETNLEIFVLGDLNCDRLKEHSLRDKMDFFYASVWIFTVCN